MRTRIRLWTIALLSWGSLAFAATPAPYTQPTFDQAVAAGGPVIVQFHADWCPTCKQQEPIVKAVLAEPKMKDVQFLVANYDTEKALKKALRVSTQSTFVVFKGGKEVARSTGQTTRAAIEGTFDKAL
ncbi:MAG: thioredoxin family protein [Ideonella sp.]|nr:thioredoxin family protein [Ideonella sp.]MCC7457895.1 thioredoxin family protein [Nitrospira sp.]